MLRAFELKRARVNLARREEGRRAVNQGGGKDEK